MVGRGKGPKGFEGEIRVPEIVRFVGVCAQPHCSCFRNFGKILRVGFFQPDRRGMSESREEAARTLFFRDRHRIH